MTSKALSISLAAAALAAIGAGAYTVGLRNGYLGPSAPARRPELYRPEDRMLKKGNDTLPEIAITFDDGPHPASLAKILQVLREQRVKATFFLVGRRIAENPIWVRAILYDGHEIGNHTQNHKRLIHLTDTQIEEEIEACSVNFQRATGQLMALYRPPGMRSDPQVQRVIDKLGLTTVAYTNACKDFQVEKASTAEIPSDEMIRRLYRGLGNGSILLLHDTPETANALEDVIVYLKAAGYRFVTITEMLSHLPSPVTVVANPDAPVLPSLSR